MMMMMMMMKHHRRRSRRRRRRRRHLFRHTTQSTRTDRQRERERERERREREGREKNKSVLMNALLLSQSKSKRFFLMGDIFFESKSTFFFQILYLGFVILGFLKWSVFFSLFFWIF